MGDVYAECLVKGKNRPLLKAMMWVFIVLAAVCVGLMLMTPFAIAFVFLFLGMAFVCHRYGEEEYEYILTNSILDIDVIYGQERRKSLCSFDLKDATMIAPLGDPKQSQKRFAVSDYSGMRRSGNVYGIFLKQAQGNREEMYIIEPDARFLSVIRQRFPHIWRA